MFLSTNWYYQSTGKKKKEGTHLYLYIYLPSNDEYVNVEGEGCVGWVQLVLVSPSGHQVLERGEVSDAGHLVPGQSWPIDTVPGQDTHIARSDLSTGGDQDMGVSVVSVPDCLHHVHILPILAVSSCDRVSWHQDHVPLSHLLNTVSSVPSPQLNTITHSLTIKWFQNLVTDS